MAKRCVALLRAVNLGGSTKLTMADLRKLAEELGLEHAATILQTGNLIFDAPKLAVDASRALHAALAERFGLKTDVFLRTAAEWTAIVDGNPYATEAKDDPAHLVIVTLSTAPKAGAADALRGAIVGREYFEVAGANAYFIYPDGIGESKLTARLIERHLGVVGTGRNWNTALKIQAALD